MRRIVLLAAVLSVALVPAAAAAQHAHGGFVMWGQGGGGTEFVDSRFSLDGGYTIEVGGRNGPYLGGRYTFGLRPLRSNEQALRERYGNASSTVEGGGGTLYDTGGDIEIGYGFGVVRVYGFTGIHYLQQFHQPVTIQSGDEEVEIITRRRESISNGRGYGVQLRLTDTGAVVAEHYRNGGEDGVMRISATRFGLRWAFY
jgi:opacity protein-like surface antigen